MNKGGHAVGDTDTVRARLTPGEFVVRKSEAQKPENKRVLERMNRGGGPGYARGGKVAGLLEEERREHGHLPTKAEEREERKGYAKGGTVTLGPEKKGQSPVTFKKGALHRQLGVPEGEKIPEAKMAKAKSGALGPLAAKRANFAEGMLKKGRQTAAKGR